jgi:dipeptidyl aminopeptidase/acylaminoacyl peptidase
VLLAFVACTLVLPAQSRLPTNEDLRHFRSVKDPKLSPDARSVIVVIGESTADGGKSHLWLIDVAGGGPRQLTYSPDNDKTGEREPTWMPDGQSILFLAHRGEHTALYRLPMHGGEAKAFDVKVLPAADTSKRSDAISLDAIKVEASRTAAETAPAQGSKTIEPSSADTVEPVAADISGYSVAPDGKTIAVLINDPQTAGEKRLKDAKADASWIDHDPHVTRLYLLDPATGKLAVTSGQPDVRDVAWSPDSARLVVVSEAPNGVGDLHPANSASILNLAQPSQPVPVPGVPATIDAAAWSRDGQRILYQAQALKDAPPGVHDLYEYTLSSRKIVNLSDGFNGTLASAGPLPLIGGETDQLVESGFDVALARFRQVNASPELLRLPVATMTAVTTNQTESGWVFLGSDRFHGSALYFASQQKDAPQLLSLPPLVPEGTRAMAAKRVHWKSDRFDIEGLLFLPENTAGSKVPLVVEAHGGPTGAFSDRFDPFVQFLLSQGWAVLRPNPRGSTGYGAAFAAANKNDLGGGDFRDIMAGVDFVLKTESIDPTRMALMGYSYGGEMAAFAESRTDRFKAIVSAAPVIDQFSEYGTEKGSIYDRWFYGYPWDHHEDAWRQSPIAGISHAKTPFLLIQGESDTVDPVGQSQEMYRALRQANVPVQLITYPRVDHGPLANAIYGGSSTEPWHGFDARGRIVTFLRQAFDKTESK